MSTLQRRLQDDSKLPWLLAYRSATWFIMMTVSFAVFTIVPVLPFALVQRVKVAPETVQRWISILLGSYGAAVIVVAPICGYLADRSPSRRLPLFLGLFALGFATVLLCIGSSIPIIIAGRLFQGASAAIVGTIGLALIADTVDQNNIGQAMGYVSLASSIAGFISPLLGGIVYAKGGYFSVFGMCFALIAFDIFLRTIMVEKKEAARWGLTEKHTEIAGLEHHTRNNLQPIEGGNTAIGLGMASTDPFLEGQEMVAPGNEMLLDETETCQKERINKTNPMITLLQSRRMLTALWGIFVRSLLLTSFDSVLPLFCKNTFGWGSTGGGLIFLTFILPLFAAPAVGKMADTYGPRWLAAGGFLSALPSLVCLRLVTHDTLGQIMLLCILLFFIGLSLVFILPPLTQDASKMIDLEEKRLPGIYGPVGARGQAFGLINCAWAAGTVAGPLWAGFVVSKAGWGAMGLTLGLLSVFSAIPTVVFTGGLITQRR